MRRKQSLWPGFPVTAIWVIAILFCGYVAVDLHRSYRQSTLLIENTATSYVRLVEEHATSAFDRTTLILRHAVPLVRAEELRAGTRMPAERHAGLQAQLAALQAESTGIVSITVTDADGLVIANSLNMPNGGNLGDRDYFRRLKAQNDDHPVISEAIRGRVSKRWGVQVARRIPTADGGFGGMIVANLGLSEAFGNFYTSLDLPPGDILLLKDLQHLVIMRYPVIEDLFGKPIPADNITRWLSEGITEAVYPSQSPIDGRWRINAFRKLHNYPLYVIVGVNQERHLAGWYTARTRSLLVGLLALAAAAIATAYLRRKAQLIQALKASEETARALLDATSDACFLLTLDGTVLSCNEVLARSLGRKVSDLSGCYVWDLFPADVADRRRAALAEAVASEQAAFLVDRCGGQHFANTFYPVRGPDGRISQAAVFSRDITQQHQDGARIQSYLHEIERSNADLEQFAYVASHDLREPLRMVTGYVGLLERRYAPRLDQDAHDFIAFAVEGAKRMDKLILDLLEFSRIKRYGDAMVPVPASEAVTAALVNLRTAIDDAQASVTVSPLPQVVADPQQLARLFQNLIANALKYRKDDQPQNITISAQRRGQEWLFTVSDTGIGIAPQYHEQIFGIFQRLHTRAKYDGTGIGLAICRSIVERHGGRIWVESQDGAGASFHFTLKAAETAA